MIVSKVTDYFYSWNVFISDREDTIAFYETDNLRKEGSSLKTKNILLGFKIKASWFHPCSKVQRIEHWENMAIHSRDRRYEWIFSNFKEKQFLEREFMWTIISTLCPTETKKLIDEAR